MDQIRDGGRQRTEAELERVRDSGWGFLLRRLCPSNRFLQLLFPSSNSSSEWNLHKGSSFKPLQSVPAQHGNHPRDNQRLLLTLGDLLDLTHQHLLVTKLLRSAWHPSTRHDTVCVPLLRARALLDDPEVDEDVILETPTASLDLVNTDSVPEFPTWPSFKSTENSPLVLYIPYLLEPSIVSMLGKFA
ncbi:hypothetical protein GmHk_05G014289 [Glycine max]|nr:hypothetical protein GmHk_05G014289 [Glycine max]